MVHEFDVDRVVFWQYIFVEDLELGVFVQDFVAVVLIVDLVVVQVVEDLFQCECRVHFVVMYDDCSCLSDDVV